MAGTLFLVGTPIGNLGDLSPRAAETLAAADFIAAEDTRVSVKLLNHLELKKPMVSYYEHNKTESGGKIVQRLLSGESCALVTDAGMPAISDPGETIVAQCAGAGIEVVGVPGPCAAVTALALSGLPTGRFTFEGFLSVNKRSRGEHLEELKTERRTMLFYEAPHKLCQTLSDLLSALGDRRVALCRELTKLHEEVIRCTLSEAVSRYRETPPRGEFVLVVEGAAETEAAPSEDAALSLVAALRADGATLRDAVREAAKATGFPKNELYARALERDE